MKSLFLFYLQLLYELFLILKRTEWERIKNLFWYSYNVPVVPFRFQWNLSFLDKFSKDTQISNFMKIPPMGTELFHADGQTHMTKLIFAFHNFMNVTKKIKWKYFPAWCFPITKNVPSLRPYVLLVTTVSLFTARMSIEHQWNDTDTGKPKY
jgi:hypothetical protein